MSPPHSRRDAPRPPAGAAAQRPTGQWGGAPRGERGPARALDGLRNRQIGIDMIEPAEADTDAEGRAVLDRDRRQGHPVECRIARVKPAPVDETVKLLLRQADHPRRRLTDVVAQLAAGFDAGIAEDL